MGLQKVRYIYFFTTGRIFEIRAKLIHTVSIHTVLVFQATTIEFHSNSGIYIVWILAYIHCSDSSICIVYTVVALCEKMSKNQGKLTPSVKVRGTICFYWAKRYTSTEIHHKQKYSPPVSQYKPSHSRNNARIDLQFWVGGLVASSVQSRYCALLFSHAREAQRMFI